MVSLVESMVKKLTKHDRQVKQVLSCRFAQHERQLLEKAAEISGQANLSRFIREIVIKEANQIVNSQGAGSEISELHSKNRTTNQALSPIPQTNWQAYNQLCEIAQRIDTERLARPKMAPEQKLFAELRELIKEVGYGLMGIGKSEK